MPSSAVRAFTDPDEYAAAIRGATVELTATGLGDFNAKLTRIDLNRIWMQRFAESLPRIMHSAVASGRAFLSFDTQPGPRQLWGGNETGPSNIIRYRADQEYFRQSSGSACFGTMSISRKDMASIGAVMAGVDLAPPKDPLVLTPPPSAMTRLQRLHAAAGHLAENAPEIIANPDTARGLEQALIEAMVDCLVDGEGREPSLAQGQHAVVMRRFHRAVEEHVGEPLYIPEICKKIGVSERTLRMCCQEHLGMAPKRYLLLRRMHLTRTALRRADPDATSVTAIGTRYGFWELGRFAVEYQALFGESPSDTLRRQPSQHQHLFAETA